MYVSFIIITLHNEMIIIIRKVYKRTISLVKRHTYRERAASLFRHFPTEQRQTLQKETASNMNWFAGSIAEAISLCQAEKLVFLVYVHDSEAHSAETNAYWEDAAVADRCVDRLCRLCVDQTASRL